MAARRKKNVVNLKPQRVDGVLVRRGPKLPGPTSRTAEEQARDKKLGRTRSDDEILATRAITASSPKRKKKKKSVLQGALEGATASASGKSDSAHERFRRAAAAATSYFRGKGKKK